MSTMNPSLPDQSISEIAPQHEMVESTRNDGQGESSRRAMVSSAMQGINRFKQSWVSVMILKSSIGLGQVITLLVLLILPTVISSPISPHRPQSQASATCPHPQLFQAWMALNICRLTICWAVSCWMVIRYQRARRRETAQDEEAAVSERPAHISPSDSAPSLSYTVASASSATLTGMSNSSHTSPTTVYTSAMASNASLDALASYAMESKQPTQSVVTVDMPPTPTVTSTEVPPSNQLTEHNLGVLQVARDLHAGGESLQEEPRGFAVWLDRWAMTISKTLGLISATLFLLGNILVFYPNPAKNITCYHSAPLLWWGVMAVVGVGWVLFAQVFFVVVIVGIGGQAVLVILRRIGVTPPPPEPAPVRAPQPQKLSPSELNKLRLVVYLPDPTEIETSSEERQPVYTPPDPSRLPYPPIYLPCHKSTCAICQENFEPPQEGRSILLKADPLRELGCGHVYHINCIDQWLLEGSANCPFCNRPVRETWEKTKVEAPVADPPKKWGRGREGRRAT